MDVIPCDTIEQACHGGFSTVELGDYVTAPNHILPTAGTARRLARLEGLLAHDASLALRVDGERP